MQTTRAGLEDRTFQVITPEEAEQFLTDGYLVVREVFPRSVAEAILPLLWAEMEEKAGDPSTWTQPGFLIQKCFYEEVTHGVLTQRYFQVLDDLMGAGRYETLKGIGYCPIRFPEQGVEWKPVSWHVDGASFHHRLLSREQGLIGVDLFTDIAPRGGGTTIRVGSHHKIAQLLAEAEPAGLSIADLGKHAREDVDAYEVRELYGQAGDVVIMHPHLVHGSSTNLSQTPRLAANRCMTYNAPMNLDAPLAELSLVELAIHQALRYPLEQGPQQPCD